MHILLKEPDARTQSEVDRKLSAILEEGRYENLPKLVFSKVGDQVSWGERFLLEIPLKTLKASIATNRAMLANWKERNANRKKYIDLARNTFGLRMPFRIVELQVRHEECHWQATQKNIQELDKTVRKMERIQSRRLM